MLFSRYSFLYNFISSLKGICFQQKDKMIALSLFMIAFTFFLIPSMHQFSSLRWSWHDYGHSYYIFRNLFEYGDLWSQELNRSHMEIHFTPFYYLLSVIFKAGNSLLFFVLLHVLALSSIAGVIFIIAVSLGWSRLFGLSLACLIIVNPYVMSANLYAHHEVFGICSLVFAIFGLVRSSWLIFLTALGVMLACKQDMWIYSVSTLFPFIFFKQHRKQAVFGITISLIYWVLAVRILWPAIWPNQINRLSAIWSYGLNSDLEILFHLVSHPLSSLPKIITDSGFWFLAGLGFVPFLSPLKSIGGFGVLFLWVNATEPNRQSLAFYYGLPIFIVFLLNTLTIQHFRAKPQSIFRQIVVLGQYLRTEYVLIGFIFFASVVSVWMQIQTPKPLKISPSLSSVFSKVSGKEHSIFFDRGLFLLNQFEKESVLADFWLAGYVPYRKDLFLFHTHGQHFIEGKYSPSFVLFSKEENDPLVPTLVKKIRQRILNSGEYVKVESSSVFSLYGHKRLHLPEKKFRSIPFEINLSQTRTIDRDIFISGWHEVEEDFVWSTGLAAIIVKKGTSDIRVIQLAIKAQCNLAGLIDGHQTLIVYVKGIKEQYVKWEIGLNSEVHVANYELPRGQETVEIIFQSLYPLIPDKIGISQDSRELGFQLERLTITNLQ